MKAYENIVGKGGNAGDQHSLSRTFITRCLFVKTVMLPCCHIDTGSGTVHFLISKELIGKYRRHLGKEQSLKPNQFHKCYKQVLLYLQCFPQLYLVCQNAALCGNGLRAGI